MEQLGKCLRWELELERPNPPPPPFPSSRYLRLCGVLPCHNLGAAGTNAAAVTLITPPPPSPPPPATHTYAVLSPRSALNLADREGLGDS